MTKTDTRDIGRTISQIKELEQLGCDIIRVAVPDKAAADKLAEIKSAIQIPLVADIHFDHRLALVALDAGVDGLRINPGNIGAVSRIKAVVRAAETRRVPIRVGVNSGSLEKDILKRHCGPTAEALVESALRHVGILEGLGYDQIKISVKASDAARTIRAYRLLSERTDCPLHLGVTEAGTLFCGTIQSSVALGALLAEGIGDTIRVSLTEQPGEEVKAGLEILRALGLKEPGPRVISCPTCGRVAIDVISLAREVEKELGKLAQERVAQPWPTVAVMGCIVNGPGEAKEADVAVAGGKGKATLYVKGKYVATLRETEIVGSIIEQVRKMLKPAAATLSQARARRRRADA